MHAAAYAISAFILLFLSPDVFVCKFTTVDFVRLQYMILQLTSELEAVCFVGHWI